jgi:hypothetical protein
MDNAIAIATLRTFMVVPHGLSVGQYARAEDSIAIAELDIATRSRVAATRDD